MTRRKPGAVRGRPRLSPPPNAAKLIEALAAGCHSLVGISKAFDISRETLRQWFDQHPELPEAYERGRDDIHLTCWQGMLKLAKKNHFTSMAYILNNMFHYGRGDASDAANRLQVNAPIQIAAMKVELSRLSNEELNTLEQLMSKADIKETQDAKVIAVENIDDDHEEIHG